MTDASTPYVQRTIRPTRRAGLFAAIWLVGAAAMAAALLGYLPGGLLLVLLIGVLLLAMTLVGALSQNVGFYACPINAIAATAAGQTLCLSFDDGPDPVVTPKVMKLLASRGHRCTFFVIGQRAAEHPELIAALHAAGHEVAIHSMRHAWHLCFWPPTTIARELNAVVETIAESGVDATPLFRPPNGILSPRVPLAVSLADMQLVGYSRRAYDKAPHASAKGCLRRLRSHIRPGAILVLHDSGGVCLEVLPSLLDELARLGLISAPIGEAIGLSTQ